jgi:hypothetical protein
MAGSSGSSRGSPAVSIVVPERRAHDDPSAALYLDPSWTEDSAACSGAALPPLPRRKKGLMFVLRLHTIATTLGRLIPLSLAVHATACGSGGARDAAAAGDAQALEAGDDRPDASPASTDAAVLGAPMINADGYATLDAGTQVFAGYVSSFSGGSGTTIELTYTTTSFCASGTVAPNSDYQSYAGAVFFIDQAAYTGGGNTGTAASVPLTGSSLTFNFSNSGGSPLELQLINQRYNFWCYDLTSAQSPVVIPLASFNTRCWDGTGNPFASGTEILGVQLVVYGGATMATPFEFCFEALTTQ